jgi:hypothetical protein
MKKIALWEDFFLPNSKINFFLAIIHYFIQIIFDIFIL